MTMSQNGFFRALGNLARAAEEETRIPPGLDNTPFLFALVAMLRTSFPRQGIFAEDYPINPEEMWKKILGRVGYGKGVLTLQTPAEIRVAAYQIFNELQNPVTTGRTRINFLCNEIARTFEVELPPVHQSFPPERKQPALVQ